MYMSNKHGDHTTLDIFRVMFRITSYEKLLPEIDPTKEERNNILIDLMSETHLMEFALPIRTSEANETTGFWDAEDVEHEDLNTAWEVSDLDGWLRPERVDIL